MARRNKVEILYHDDALLVVDKPAGLLSVPGRDAEEGSVLQVLLHNHDTVLPVHRLDRNTSGVMLFARSEEAHKHLSGQFMQRKVQKHYLVLVKGRPLSPAFTIDLPLGVDRNNLAIVSSQGRKSVTEFEVIEQFSRFCLLEARPLTGRQHQIRAHLAASGYPLLVDADYGSPEQFTIFDIKSRAGGWHDPEAPALLKRTPLHAASVSFLHPVTNTPQTFSAELPKDMTATLNQIRKWDISR